MAGIKKTIFVVFFKGLMHVSGRPVGSFDNEGLIFAAGVDAEIIRLYDLRSFDKVCNNVLIMSYQVKLYEKRTIKILWENPLQSKKCGTENQFLFAKLYFSQAILNFGYFEKVTQILFYDLIRQE